MISDLLIRHLRWRWHPLLFSERPILSVSNSNSLQKSSAIQKISVILSLVIIVIFIVIDWISTIKLQKYNEITNFLQTFLIPSSGYYTFFVKEHLSDLFPNQLSYNRFLELEARVSVEMMMFLQICCFGRCTGINLNSG